MFHIKICGVRRLDEVRAVVSAGADAIGLNFFPPSVRYLEPESSHAVEMSRLAREYDLRTIGVFVNESPERVVQVAELVGLEAIQLHGDEDLRVAEEIRSRCGLPLIRAIKLPVSDLKVDHISKLTRPWIEFGAHLLLDADAGREHGGSGKQLDWSVIRVWADMKGRRGEGESCDWTLAGGLNPSNVSEAIRISGAESVDTASGVEEPRGIKSADKIVQFVQQCQV